MLYFWIGAIAVFVVLELLTPQLICIWFAIGSIAGLVSEKLGATEWLQIAIFAVVSLVMLIITRPIYRKYIKTKTVPTNADRLVSQNGIVVERIDNLNAVGSVQVNGQIWSAKSADSEPIDIDELVCVEKIEGVKLIVSKKNKN